MEEKFYLKQLLKYGYFSENLPSSFNTDLLVENLGKIMTNLGDNVKLKQTESTEITVYKNELNRRVISIPNIASFLECANLLDNNINKVKYLSKSENSHSCVLNNKNRINKMDFVENSNDLLDDNDFINTQNFKDYFGVRSDFNDSLKDNINLSVGKIWLLKIDISNFYNSIYTHSITWSVFGKEQAQKMEQKKGKKTEDYIFLDKFDRAIRNMNTGVTNGIITGPFVSRIFSEIILANLDKRFREKGYKFFRYVDDYKFYFRNKNDAEEAEKFIISILNNFNFQLNESKRELIEYPFNIKKDLRTEFKSRYLEDGIFGVLNKAIALYNYGEKGAIKYALKFISKKKIQKSEDCSIIFSILFNIILLNSNNGKYVVNFISRNKDRFNLLEIEDILNEEVRNNVKNNKDYETIICLELLIRLNKRINAYNFGEILESKNDLAIIMVLEYYKKLNILEYHYSKLEELSKKLSSEDYDKGRWFLLYEIKIKKLLPNFEKEIYSGINYNDKLGNIFKVLEKNKIDFYIQ